ncbi:hypothetical protein ASG93_30585 [Paenibacillus sp. Soil787]|nr:hypothetical protein ASG93_30585 [Paenibacillus sp. Soil787]
MHILFLEKAPAIKEVTEAERVYSLVTIDGVPHFHAHFIPRKSDCSTKGIDFIKQDGTCSEIDAINLARKLNLFSTQLKRTI